MKACDLPAPRAQLRWAPATKQERRKHWSLIPDLDGWTCHYELVLPLRRGDIRRRLPAGHTTEVLAIPMGKTVISGDAPRHAPYRDSAHLRLDAAALGGLPVYLITADGETTLMPASATEARRAETHSGSVHEDAARRETPVAPSPDRVPLAGRRES